MSKIISDLKELNVVYFRRETSKSLHNRCSESREITKYHGHKGERKSQYLEKGVKQGFGNVCRALKNQWRRSSHGGGQRGDGIWKKHKHTNKTGIFGNTNNLEWVGYNLYVWMTVSIVEYINIWQNFRSITLSQDNTQHRKQVRKKLGHN